MTTILCINPDSTTQQALRAGLGQSYNLVTVADGPAAIQYCAMIQPDLVLLDASLADIDVTELVLRLKMFMPQTPILIIDQADNPPAATVTGVDGYLARPVSPAELRQKVRRLLPEPATTAQVSPPALTERTLEQFESQIQALNQANQRLASLNVISALIGTSLDLEHLTDEILRQIQKTVDFDSATLFLLKGNILEAAASRGFLDFQRGLNVYPKSQRNSAWRVVINKLPFVINDVTRSEDWEPRPELSQVRSWLGVPLIFKDRVVGVLTLDKNQPNAFTDADARFVFTLAFQIAVTVENAQLFQEWENQATRLKLINEVNQKITTILDTGQLYHTLAQTIVERLGYDRAAIFEMTTRRDGLLLRAYITRPNAQLQPLPPALERYPLNTGLIGRAIRTEQPVLVGEIADPGQVLPGAPAQSALILPVFVGSRVEAVIYLDSLLPHAFNDHDLWTLSSVVIQTGTVLENARLYQGIDAYSAMLEKTVLARTQRLQAIKQISQVISQGVSVDDLLAVVGRQISRIFTAADGETNQVATGLIAGSQLVVRDISQVEAPNGIVSETCKLAFPSVVGQVMQDSRPVILNNVDLPRIYTAILPASPHAHNALMVAPLITAGKTIGVIMVQSQRSGVFDHDDLETLESVAFQVASAIESARLLRKTKDMAIVDERTRLARDMHDGVAQNLAYLLIQVDRCLNMVEAGSKVEQQLEMIGSLLEQNIDELRRNILDLRPVEFEGKSVFEVLEGFVTEFGRRWNLQVSCHIDGQASHVPAAVESSLYRIVQEALANARRHAHCRRVAVDVSVTAARWLVLRIEDDGRGFDLNGLPTEGRGYGLGLVSMRERAESVDGRFSITSSLNNGTRIIAELPLTFGKEGE